MHHSYQKLEHDVDEQGRGLRFVNSALKLAAADRLVDKAHVQLYRRIFDSLPLGIVVMRLEKRGDSDSLRVIEMNPTGLHLARVPGDKAAGEMLRNLAPKIYKTELPEACLDVLKSGESRVLREFSGDGEAQGAYFHVRIFALNEECVGIAFENVSEQKKAQSALHENEQLLRLMIESVQDYAIYRLDRDGRVASWNDGAQIINGYDAEEILGQTYEQFFTPEDRTHGLPQELLNRTASEGRLEIEGWRLRKDGSRFWANAVITALREEGGALLGYVQLVRDITERTKNRADPRKADHSSETFERRALSVRLRGLAWICASLCTRFWLSPIVSRINLTASSMRKGAIICAGCSGASPECRLSSTLCCSSRA